MTCPPASLQEILAKIFAVGSLTNNFNLFQNYLQVAIYARKKESVLASEVFELQIIYFLFSIISLQLDLNFKGA